MPIRLSLEPTPAKQESVLKYLVNNFLRIKDAFAKAIDGSLSWDALAEQYGGTIPWNPTVTQTATVTWNSGTSTLEYTKIGDLVIGNFVINVTSAGTAGAQINIGIPVTATSAGAKAVGSGHVFIGGANVPMNLALSTTGTFSYIVAGGYYSPNPGLVNGNSLVGCFHYKAA